jgi:GH18 family chitinase
VDDDDNWYSFNKPNHESFERKVKYIMTHGFGGVGLMHMEADDPYDHCGTGPYPLTNYLSRHLTCTKPKVVHGGSTECKRLCIYRPEYATISFQNLKPEWCSHIVISSAKFNSTGCIEEAASFKNAIVDYNTWSARKKPFLVISIGADMDNENWQSVLKDSNATHVLIDHIWQFYKDSNADGVSIDFVATKISSDIQDNFHVFLENLKKVKPKTAVIFVTVTYVSTISNAYNVQKINSASDYIIIEGYKFHSINEEFTGHHSPLFMTNILPVSTDSLKSIEGLANAWTKRGVPNNKIILGFSAVGQTQPIIMKNPKTRSDDDADEFLRLKTDISDVSTTRSSGPGYISQTELCEALHKSNATNRFYDDISVPVGKVGDDFYAYDDMRSIHTKSVWASLNHFAGVSFYGIENDNPDAICPSTEPFNLLQKIAQSQVGNKHV